MSTEKVIKAGLVVDTGDSRQNIEAVQSAVAGFGEVGVRNASAITGALQNIESASDHVNRKITEGRAVTVRDGSVMIQQFELLKDAINHTFGSLANAPAEVQQAFAKAQTQFDNTTSKIRTLTTATTENKTAISGNAAQWGGFEQQLLKVVGADGPLGKAIIGLSGVTAAFTAGAEAGNRLNRFFGTDMSVWEETSARFGQKAGLIIRDLSDIIVAEFNAVSALLHGNLAEAKRSFQEAGKDIFKLGSDMSAVLTKTGADWDKYTIGTGLATKANKDAQESAAKLREEKEKLRKEINEVTKALKNETLELQKQKDALLDSEHGVIDQTSDLGYYKRQVDAATTALEQQKQTVIELTQRYGDNNPVVTQAREKQVLLEQSLRSSQERYDQTSAEVQKYEEQQRAAKAAVEKATEKVAELTKEQAKLQAEATKLTTATSQQATAAGQSATSTQAAATATESHAAAAGHAATQIITYRDAAGRLHIETTNLESSVPRVAAATEQAATSAEHAATATQNVAAAAGQANTALSAIATTLASEEQIYGQIEHHLEMIATHLVTIAQVAPDAAKGLQQIGDQGTGDGGRSGHGASDDF